MTSRWIWRGKVWNIPKILQIRDVKSVKEEIQRHFFFNEDARFVRRLDVISLICDGHSTNCVARLFGFHPTTVQRWIHRLNKSGIEGLMDMPGKGRRPSLKNTDHINLRKELAKPPRDLGYEQARWDGKLLSHHLKVRYGVELKARQCQNLLKKIGVYYLWCRKISIH